MNLISIKSFRSIYRNLKVPELGLLIFTLILSVFCVSSILLFTQGIKTNLEDSTGSLLGGDRVLSSQIVIDPEIIQNAKASGIQSSSTVLFYSMLVKNSLKNPIETNVANPTINPKTESNNQEVHNQKILNQEILNQEPLALAEVKAVDKNYPLKGELHSSKSLYGEDEILQKTIPEPDTVWLEANLFTLLNADIGDTIQIGQHSFKITRVLSMEPDRGGEGLTFAPRALINLQDLSKTQVIGAGSRQQYKLLLTGTPQALTSFEIWLKPKLTAGQKLISAKESRPLVKTVLDQAENYLSLIIILNLLIAALAISQASRRFAWRQYPLVAILRCFGASYRWILSHFMIEMMFYSSLATTIGYLVAVWVFLLSKKSFEGLLAQNISVVGFGAPLYVAMATGLLLTLLFVFPTLMKLKKLSPLWIFRQRRGRVESGLTPQFSPWKRIVNSWMGSLNVEARYGVSQLLRYPLENAMQIFAFTLVFTCALLLFLLRNDLISTWQLKTPVDAPNYFAINIFPDAVNKFQRFLEKNNIKAEKLYPVIRGNLLKINDEPVNGLDKQLDKQSESSENSHNQDGSLGRNNGNSKSNNNGDNSSNNSKNRNRANLRRPLNLTFDNTLPADNTVVAGEWFSKDDEGKPFVSVEKGFAERMDIQLNDRLTFQIEGKEWIVRVKSFRQVVWDSFRPNFFVIFPPKVFEDLPFTYITSFYLNKKNQFLLREMVKEFPEINLIDMTLILKNIDKMIIKISNTIEFLWAITGIMAFLLLFCTLLVNLEEKRNNAILFRALGVSRQKIAAILLSEFIIIGGLSGFIASLVASILYLYIGNTFFQLPVKIQPSLLLLTPLLGMLLLSLGSYLGLRKVFKVTPREALSLR